MQLIEWHGLTDVVLVAHSKGGLIGKYAMTYLDPTQRIRRLIAVSTLFTGSKYAYLFLFGPLKLFTSRDSVLRQLEGEGLVNAWIVSIYSQFDLHIPGGSHLEGGENARVSSIGHFRILADLGVIEEILKRL